MDSDRILTSIWEMIDGTATEAAAAHTRTMIATDAEWAKVYEEALSLHEMIRTELSPEPVSAGFTGRVIRSVASETSVKAKPAPIVVRVLVTLMLAGTGILIIMLFWGEPGASQGVISKTWQSLSSTMNSHNTSVLLQLMTAATIILSLALADGFLRRRITH